MGETQQLETIDHPTLGPMSFPKDMHPEERNRHIQDRLAERAERNRTPTEFEKQRTGHLVRGIKGGLMGDTGATATDVPAVTPMEEQYGRGSRQGIGERELLHSQNIREKAGAGGLLGEKLLGLDPLSEVGTTEKIGQIAGTAAPMVAMEAAPGVVSGAGKLARKAVPALPTIGRVAGTVTGAAFGHPFIGREAGGALGHGIRNILTAGTEEEALAVRPKARPGVVNPTVQQHEPGVPTGPGYGPVRKIRETPFQAGTEGEAPAPFEPMKVKPALKARMRGHGEVEPGVPTGPGNAPAKVRGVRGLPEVEEEGPTPFPTKAEPEVKPEVKPETRTPQQRASEERALRRRAAGLPPEPFTGKGTFRAEAKEVEEISRRNRRLLQGGGERPTIPLPEIEKAEEAIQTFRDEAERGVREINRRYPEPGRRINPRTGEVEGPAPDLSKLPPRKGTLRAEAKEAEEVSRRGETDMQRAVRSRLAAKEAPEAKVGESPHVAKLKEHGLRPSGSGFNNEESTTKEFKLKDRKGNDVGFIYLSEEQPTVGGPKDLFVQSVDLDQEYRKKGVGSAFYEHVIEQAREHGYESIISDNRNKHSQRVWEKLTEKHPVEGQDPHVKKLIESMERRIEKSGGSKADIAAATASLRQFSTRQASMGAELRLKLKGGEGKRGMGGQVSLGGLPMTAGAAAILLSVLLHPEEEKSPAIRSLERNEMAPTGALSKGTISGAGGKTVTGKVDLKKDELQDKAKKVATSYKIPTDLYHRLVEQESRWDAKAKSGKGAVGLTQMMPRTAKSLGVDLKTPEGQLEGGAKYLRQLYDRFQSWELAVAAYNAGPGRVQKAGLSIPKLPWETRNYVRKVAGPH